MPAGKRFCKKFVTYPETTAYLKAGMGTFGSSDDSSDVNVHALPIRGIELGMLLLNLGVWLYAAGELAGTVMPA